MQIVLINRWFAPESGWGGVARYNEIMARALCAQGHSVTVITSRLSLQMPPRSKSNGISVHRLLIRDAYRWQKLPGIGRYVRALQLLTYSWRVNRLVRELAARGHVDVCESAEINAEGFFLARGVHPPLVVRAHTPTFVLKCYHAPGEMAYHTRLTEYCEKDLIQRADALTAPSTDMANVITNACALRQAHMTVIPNPLPLPPKPAAASSAQVNILYVGRLERSKGVAVLARAIPGVLGAIPNARFVFIGADRRTADGQSQQAALQQELRQAGNSVRFLGGVDEATLLGWYQRADICVVPSLLYESFSYTCAQAMAAAKPVVASRIGGIPETVSDGVTGILTQPGDSEALSEGIIRLTRDAALCRMMGQAGREKVQAEFDPTRIAARTEAVYQQAMIKPRTLH